MKNTTASSGRGIWIRSIAWSFLGESLLRPNACYPVGFHACRFLFFRSFSLFLLIDRVSCARRKTVPFLALSMFMENPKLRVPLKYELEEDNGAIRCSSVVNGPGVLRRF
ncbi:hypothetical protein HPP92_004726 [Vanilla planifolia]|uniref:Uncharacterized protein n=1 Tax=Vanilla planifolia TaxID=51239 RepID=A0A835VCJ5_VANPL|nr:hypothetical protein HPP92_004726 [Vanilla planifolia]